MLNFGVPVDTRHPQAIVALGADGAGDMGAMPRTERFPPAVALIMGIGVAAIPVVGDKGIGDKVIAWRHAPGQVNMVQLAGIQHSHHQIGVAGGNIPGAGQVDAKIAHARDEIVPLFAITRVVGQELRVEMHIWFDHRHIGQLRNLRQDGLEFGLGQRLGQAHHHAAVRQFTHIVEGDAGRFAHRRHLGRLGLEGRLVGIFVVDNDLVGGVLWGNAGCSAGDKRQVDPFGGGRVGRLPQSDADAVGDERRQQERHE